MKRIDAVSCRASDPASPYLIVAAFWTPSNVVDEVVYALSDVGLPRITGRHGSVVSFREDVASLPSFRRLMYRLKLEGVNAR